jgi:hypothetical protein
VAERQRRKRQKLTVSRLLAETDNREFLAELSKNEGLLEAEGLAVVLLDGEGSVSVFYRGLEPLAAIGLFEVALSELVDEGYEDD